MRKAALLFIILFSLSYVAAGQTLQDKKIEQELLSATRRLTDALEKRDVAALEKLLADDYTGLNAYAKDLGSRSQFLAAFQADGKTAVPALANREVKVLIGDEHNAMVISRSSRTGKFEGPTVVWHKRQGKWQVLMLTSEIRSSREL